jgi:DNA-binding transcriptional ArsR family regulator
MGQVLKEIFGDTKRINILEELVENWGEWLTVEEIARIAETSPKTAYNHINELMNIKILDCTEGKPKKFKFKEDDKRALALAILESEEYLRKTEISVKKVEEIELNIETFKPFSEVYKSNTDDFTGNVEMFIQYSSPVEAK